MCGSSGGSSSSQRVAEEQLALQREEVGRQRWMDDQRQARIDHGTSMIDQRFWELDPTGARPGIVNPPALNESYEEWADRTGYGVDSQHSNAHAVGDLLNQGNQMRWDAQQEEKVDDHKRLPGAEDPTSERPGPPFEHPGPSIYDQREQDYLNWANPQVSQQFGDADRQLQFQLARMGHAGGSSSSIDRTGRLQDDYTLERANVADRGVDLGNQARQQVADERSRLMGLLHSTGDPSAVQGQLGTVIDSIRTAPAFNALGPMFQNATAGLGSYLDGARFGQMQSNVNQTPIYSSPSSGSGRVVR